MTSLDLKLQHAICPMGCAESDAPVLVGTDILHGIAGEFQVVQCRHCGLMRTNPRPAPQDIGNYYPEHYGPYLGTRVQQGSTVSRARKFIRSFFKSVFDFNTENLPSMAPGRLLEVGCASGAFLHQMAQKKWHVNGIEFSEKAAKAAADLGYPVFTGALEDAPPPDAPYDLIVGWMVLEHLHEPVEGLKKLRQWAAPGACLALSVPNAGAIEFKLFKGYWYALQLPTHLYHFTPATLEKMLELAGWRVEKVMHHRVLSNLVASAGYALRAKGFSRIGEALIGFPESSGRLMYLLFPIAWVFALFGQTGRMSIWARAK